jgi:hypothetical protein
MLVNRKNFAGKPVSMEIPVTVEQIEAWQNGELIQRAMPNLNADQREFLMTGMLLGEWDELVPEEEPEHCMECNAPASKDCEHH